MNQMQLTIVRIDSQSSDSINTPRPVRGQEKDRSDSTSMDQSSATNVASLDTMPGGVLAADQQQSQETTSLPCIGSSRRGLGQCDPCEQF